MQNVHVHIQSRKTVNDTDLYVIEQKQNATNGRTVIVIKYLDPSVESAGRNLNNVTDTESDWILPKSLT